jgi:uncharacterized RDD family membrane protein YckC
MSERHKTEELAGFWVRILAGAIDGIFIAGPLYLIATFYPNEDSYFLTPRELIGLFLGLFIFPIVALVYSSLMESSHWQGTFGKRAIGIKVEQLNSERLNLVQGVKRALAKGISVLPLFFGVFAIALSDKKAAFHDRLCKTVVVKDRNRYWLKDLKPIMNQSTNIHITNSQGVVLTLAEHMQNVTTQVTQNIQKLEQSSEIKQLIEVLTRQIREVSSLCSKDSVDAVEKMAKELTRLSEEVATKKPDKAWYQLSLSGIKEAAEAVGAIGKPILDTLIKIWPLLMG